MNSEFGSNERQPLENSSQLNPRFLMERQLRSLQPQMPQVDYERLDVLLAGREEARVAEKANALASDWSTGHSWGAIAAAWCFGVTVGVLMMLAAGPPRQPQQAAVSEKDRVPTTTAPRSPAPGSIATHDSEVPQDRPLSDHDDALRFARRSAIDDAVWEAALAAEQLRAGSYIYTRTILAAPSAQPGLASNVENVEVVKPSGASVGPESGTLAPMPTPRPPTPRRVLSELLGGGGGTVL